MKMEPGRAIHDQALRLWEFEAVTKCREPTHWSAPSCSAAIRQLGGADVFRTLSFGALADGVVHSLTFSQFVKSDTIKVRHVEENVSTVGRANESETLVRHLLDCAFRHRSHLFITSIHNFARTTCPSQLIITAGSLASELKKRCLKGTFV